MQTIEVKQEIIDGCRQKNKLAQETLYKLCYKPFMIICLRYALSYDDASDILQNSWIKIFTKIDGYTNNGNFVGWMRRIVVNTAIDFTREKKKDTNIDIENIKDIIDETEETKFVIDEKELLTMIRKLPAMHSKVFNLFAIEEYSHKEICELLGISVETSRWYLFNARKMLQEQLAKTVNE